MVLGYSCYVYELALFGKNDTAKGKTECLWWAKLSRIMRESQLSDKSANVRANNENL